MLPQNSLQALLRHELLNRLTVLEALCDDHSKTPQKRARFRAELKTMGLLIAHEDVFLGKKPEFFRQRTDIGALLEVVLESFRGEFRSKKIALSFSPPENFFISCDRYYVAEGFSKIFCGFLAKTSFLRCVISPRGTVILEYEAPDPAWLKIRPLSSCFRGKMRSQSDVFYQLGLHILEAHKKSPRIAAGKMEIFL